MEKPFLSNALNKFIGPRYSLHVRPLSFGVMQEQPPLYSNESRERITGEIVLESSEHVPVQIISSEHIIPTPEAQESGFWQPEDEFFSIRDTDLTPEQARQARYFVRPYPPSIGRKLSSENG